MSKAQGDRPEAGEDKLTGLGDKLEPTDKAEKAEVSEEPKRPAPGGGDLTIYLFGRTGREKEEWFRRFLLASRIKSEVGGGSLPGICKSGEFQNEQINLYTVQYHTLKFIQPCTVYRFIGLSQPFPHTQYVHTHTHIIPHIQNSHSLEYVTAQTSDLCLSPSLGTANLLN